jgi:deoxyhypusine synthase
MLDDGDTIWLGISGAGIAGGLGGVVSQLIRNGMVHAICSTGAQIYHDLHFAFALPVKAISPHADDDLLREHGDTRIYDIGIREVETLEAQDDIVCRFIEETYDTLKDVSLPGSPTFNRLLGEWVLREAPHPERSFVVAAYENGVPLFWDSHTNHSIAMNIARVERTGKRLRFPVGSDIEQSAAIVYGAGRTGFLELGGGGPKNFIQQTGPYLSQILGYEYEGADRGIQISSADPRDGGLSGCTFGEAVTWKKYRHATGGDLVQVWAEYSIVFPLLAAYVLERCAPRTPPRLSDRLETMTRALETSSP